MLRGVKTTTLMLSGLLVIGGADALSQDEGSIPYHGIVERNVFGLRPPTPPAPPPEPPKTPPPKITLNGIMTIFGHKQALMQIQVPPKPPAPAKQESYILREGQRDGDIEVISIDVAAGKVKVKNHGEIQDLDFEHDGAKSNPPLAVGAPGRIPPIPHVGNRPVPPSLPLRRVPTRTLPQLHRIQPNNQAAAQQGAPGGIGSTARMQQRPMTADQQAALIELQRLEYQSKGNPVANLMPPTSLTPDAQGDQGNTAPSPMPQ